ncbi:MAG TPA: chloride channel protein, partial [Acidimicrobiia bacterium]|nr:chloride channel protein [Acidimicrobiia bacterium]
MSGDVVTSLPNWLRKPLAGRTPRLVILAGVVGAGAGLGAVVLIWAIRVAGNAASWITTNLTVGQLALLVVVPLGIWISWGLTRVFAPEVAGHGVPQIIASITVRGGRIRSRVMPLKVIATGVTIGAGGSAGREGSIAQIGSAIGSWLGRLGQLGEKDVIVLVAAGAGAGISATFNAPIAGMFFAMEVILRRVSMQHLHTTVIASVAGAVVAHSIVGDELTFSVQPHTLKDPLQLVLFAVLGLVATGMAWLYMTALDWFEVKPRQLPGWVRPLLLGLLVASLGLWHEEVLGTGQTFVNQVLRNEIDLAWWILIVIAVLKAIATAATLGGHGSGGIFMPSLFIGATSGSAFALLAGQLWTISAVSPGAYALVGMAATFAAVAHAPLTSILIVFEITGDYGLVLPLMLATAIATILSQRVRPLSAYSAVLARMGIHPVEAEVTDLLDTVTVGATMSRNPLTATPNVTLGEAQGLLNRTRLRCLPIVNNSRLVGILTESDVVRAGGPSDQVTTGEAMTPDPSTVDSRVQVSDALERLAALGVGQLPVIDRDNRNRLVGVFTRDNVVTAYHSALGVRSRAAVRSQGRELDTTSDTGFFELVIPEGSTLDGRKVSEVGWPEGCVVVSVHRGSSLLVPRGTTVLKAKDA